MPPRSWGHIIQDRGIAIIFRSRGGQEAKPRDLHGRRMARAKVIEVELHLGEYIYIYIYIYAGRLP